MIFVNIRILPDELKKISHKSFYKEPITGYEECATPGYFWYIPRLQFNDSWDRISIHNPETQSLLFKDWCVCGICEFAPNKILATTLGNCMFIIHDFNVAKFIDGCNYEDIWKG